MYVNKSIAFFISPHGFGHAARSCAVIQKLSERLPKIEFHIFTLTPEWLFKDSLKDVCYHYHPLKSDVGFVQDSPLHIDFKNTLKELQTFIPPDRQLIETLSASLNELNCLAIVCDISPIGLLAGSRLDIPVFLLENFTWDWMYEFYLDLHPWFTSYISFFKEIYQQVDYHIQAEPFSYSVKNSFICAPISRRFRNSREHTRKSLNITTDKPVLLLSTGGIASKHDFLEKLARMQDLQFIVPNDAKQISLYDNIIELPHHSQYYHPDLVNAADAVICKVGYSTIAEIYQAGLPVLYVSRKDFRESYPISDFLHANLPSIEISVEEFEQQNWFHYIPDLIKKQPLSGNRPNGDIQCADFIIKKII